MESGRRAAGDIWNAARPCAGWDGASPSLSFYGHVIDLAAEVDDLFKRLDSAVRRGIRKAEAAGLHELISTASEAIETFFALHCRTRRRHGLPPQPFRFFDNIQRAFLDAGQGFVATARLKEPAAGGGCFFFMGGQALYKFGASDHEFQQLRPNNLMMWEAMRRCAAGWDFDIEPGPDFACLMKG